MHNNFQKQATFLHINQNEFLNILPFNEITPILVMLSYVLWISFPEMYLEKRPRVVFFWRKTINGIMELIIIYHELRHMVEKSKYLFNFYENCNIQKDRITKIFEKYVLAISFHWDQFKGMKLFYNSNGVLNRS